MGRRLEMDSAGKAQARQGWIVLGLTVLLALHAWRIKSGIDLQVYLRAGSRALVGEEIYVLSESSPFKYSPPVALLFAPLSLLPTRAAQLLWVLISAAAFTRFVQLQGRGTGLGAWWRPLLVLGLASPYLSQVLFLGQADALLVWLMALSELDAKRAPLRSGVLWAIVCLFKLPFLLFGLLVVAFGEGRRLLGLTLGLALFAFAGVLRFGLAGLLHEVSAWRALLAESTPVSLIATDNQSLTAILCSLGLVPEQHPGWLSALTLVLSAALLLASTLVTRRVWMRDRAEARTLAGALTFYLAAFLSPLGWLSNLVVIVPVAWGLISLRERPLAKVGLVVLGAAVLCNYDLLGREVFVELLRLKVFGWATLLSTGCLALATATGRMSGPESPARNTVAAP
jgi:hypothetical protein